MSDGAPCSSDRPLPFRVRPDLEVTYVNYGGIEYPVIKDPVALTYFRLTPEQFALLASLDGSKGIENILRILQERFPGVHFTLKEIQNLLIDLTSRNLVLTDRVGRADAIIRDKVVAFWRRFRNPLMGMLFLKFPVWNPRPLLNILYPLLWWLFYRPVVIVALCFVAYSWSFAYSKYEIILGRLPEFEAIFRWPNVAWLWCSIALTKAIHEVGHALCCRYYGKECHGIGILLLLLSPTLYCDVSDSWTLRSKWQRIAIGAAGIYFELILSSACIFVWWNTNQGLLHHLALNMFFVSALTTVVFNANPLLRRYDGYYMLTDFLEVPNLRRKSSKLIFGKLESLLLAEPEPPADPLLIKPSWILITYGVFAAAYRTFIIIAIAFLLFRMLEPLKLQYFGLTIGVAVVARRLWTLSKRIYQKVSKAWQDPLRKGRVALSMTVLSILALGVCFVPFPWTLSIPVYVESGQLTHVYSSASGIVVELPVKEGDTVQAGDTIIRLVDPQAEAELIELQQTIAANKIQLKTHRALGDLDAAQVAEVSVNSALAQLKQLQEQQRRLRIPAPKSGMVVAAEYVPAAPTAEAETIQLPSWSGSPISEKNMGALIAEQTHICSIASTTEALLTVFVDQNQCDLLNSDTTITVTLDHLPWRKFDARLGNLSADPQDVVPSVMSTSYGGTMTTIAQENGVRLTSVAYAGHIRLSSDVAPFQTGMRGMAHVKLTKYSLGQRILRSLRKTIHSRL